MNRKMLGVMLAYLIPVLLSAVLLLSISGGSIPVRAADSKQQSSFSLFLPLLVRYYPLQNIFGVEMSQITSSGGLDQMATANAGWVRRNAVIWSDVEPNQGDRNWNAPSIVSLDQELSNAAAKNMQVILVVRSTPPWAQKVSGSYCGPVKPDALGAFSNFMRDLVARYSLSPYNVRYWEIWNEPDVDPNLVGSNSPFGCWGDQNDFYYGGGYYAQMLQVVYPQIKGADPRAQVLVGGLLLNCSPNFCPSVGSDEKPPRFLEGILKAGGGLYFDGVAFHAYDQYLGSIGQYGISGWNSAWNTTGPTVIAKSNFVKSVLAKYGTSGKFLMNTETALLCDSCTGDSTFETAKAYYIAQLYAAAIGQGLSANVWFSVYGWRNSSLLDGTGTPLPAYNAFNFGAHELNGAQLDREISEYPGVKGYGFTGAGDRTWVLWSLDGKSHSLTLPGFPAAVYHADGTPIPLSQSLTVTLEPYYLKWIP